MEKDHLRRVGVVASASASSLCAAVHQSLSYADRGGRPGRVGWVKRAREPAKGAATGVDGRLGYTRAALGRRPQQSDGIFELVVVQNHAQAQQRLYSLPAANTAKPGGTHGKRFACAWYEYL